LLTGFKPLNVDLFRLATRHSSAVQGKEHNERLEYLGDAVLGLIVAEFLFKKFPFKEEGLMCSNCVFYIGGGACEIVKGKIEPEAICKLWIIPQELIKNQ
jgi:dsRNA-specific ribonuclease